MGVGSSMGLGGGSGVVSAAAMVVSRLEEGSGVSVPVGLRIGLGNDNSQCGTGHRLYCHCSSRVVMSIMII